MKSFADIRELIFAPLSEIKAKLSAMVRQVQKQGKRIVLTNKGRPAAVLLAYDDYLELITAREANEQAGASMPRKVLTLTEWRRQRPQRRQVVEAITSLFDPTALQRKGQKSYKEKRVREFDRVP